MSKNQFQILISRFDKFESEVNKRFDGLEKRFDKFESEVNKRFEKIDKRFEKIDQDHAHTMKKFQNVEITLSNIKESIEQLQSN